MSELGYKHLDYIRSMRNWASAAHPNQTELGGFQLLGWLQTCVREVIALPPAMVTIEIKRLLLNIKSTTVSADDAEEIATFFATLPQDRANNLGAGLFGLYTRSDTAIQTRQNIQALAPALWELLDGLVERGWCTPERRDGVLRFPTTPCPISSYVNHVKLVFERGRVIDSKVYVFFWRSPEARDWASATSFAEVPAGGSA